MGSTPPTITPITPVDGETGVAKDTAIIFTVIDTESGVVFSSIQVWVRGVLAFDGTNFLAGWKQSAAVAITDGYQFELIADRSRYARSNTETGIRVVAEDVATNAANENWAFAATSNLGSMASYRFILGSIRDLDEELG